MKRIAVLSTHFSETVAWLKEMYPIRAFDLTTRQFTAKDGTVYEIISDVNQLIGLRYNFNSYMRAPDYHTLEDYVKTRINPGVK